MKGRTISILSVCTAAIGWELAVRVAVPEPRRFIFSLSEMLAEWGKLFHNGLMIDITATLVRTIGGFLGAALLGIGLGLLIGRSPTLHQIARPLIDFLRPLPSSALIPVVIILPMLGLKERSFYVIVIYGSLWPVLFNTITGVSEVSSAAAGAIRMLQLSPLQRLRYFILPEAAPEIFTGLKIALGISLILAITAELLIGGRGLGSLMRELGDAADYAGMYSTILVIALLGWTLNSAFNIVEKNHPWLRGRESLIDDAP
ncbi:MAG: ABC transporter permease subunit [Gemmatimonadales bacterium]|nr:ABC transporter permease subunit [Gemmatimonadales bacterium]